MDKVGIEKHRKCPKCNRDRNANEFPDTTSPFFFDHKSYICIDCLERMMNAEDLEDVDKTLQWLNLPFFPDQWTRLYKKAKDKTLRFYLSLIGASEEYKGLDWGYTNQLWQEAMAANTMVDHIDGANDAWKLEMARKWPAEMDRTTEDYHYLENLYSDLLATQNLVTATQRDDAKRLCELGLLINKKIRGGLDAKNEMAKYYLVM